MGASRRYTMPANPSAKYLHPPLMMVLLTMAINLHTSLWIQVYFHPFLMNLLNVHVVALMWKPLLIGNKQGLCHYFNIECRNISCRWSKCFSTNKEVERDGRGANPFDINLQAILTFLEIGRGHASIKTFCGCMNMPPPMTEATYNNAINTMHPSYVEVASKVLHYVHT